MNNGKENKNRSDRDKRMLFAVSLCLLVTVAATIVGIWGIQKKATVLAPDYAPRDTEKNAVSIGDDGDKKLDQPKGGGAVSLTYAKEVSVSISGKTATLLFANPTKSNQDMVLQLAIDDVVILQSGRLTPGNKVSELSLLDGAEKRLAAGGYHGKFVVLYYDRTSGEKAMVNTEIPVNVTVTD